MRGLAIFQEWFKEFQDQYVLIGGTAASITMDQAGLPFRATKDIDIVLHIEALTPAFGQKFWEFVQAAGYQKSQGNPDQRPCLYRFQKPTDEQFPAMLELFSRIPDALHFVPPGHLTPIPMDEQISSLSAILLDDAYYQFVLTGRQHRQGIPSWVGEDRLIPLKAVAWLEMNERARAGEVIDSKKINKHLSDVVQLSALLQPGKVIALPEKLRADLQAFIDAVVSISNPNQLSALIRVAQAYALQMQAREN